MHGYFCYLCIFKLPIPLISLKPYTTFGLEAQAQELIPLRSEADIHELAAKLPQLEKPLLILGGGSNILFTKDFPGTVLHMQLKGKTLLGSNDQQVFIRVAAGEDWDEFVAWTVEQGYGGLENLSLIPGTVGAAPVQNIGAYGRELSDCLMHVEAFDLAEADEVFLAAEDCELGYRSSVFKRKYKNRLLITHLVFALDLLPQYKLSYGGLKEEVKTLGEVSLQNVRQAVINIRNRKLPDPEKLGNAGSFFKNPVIPEAQAKQLLEQYPECPSYPAGDGYCKLAAGWLIDQLGWKGRRQGDAGVHTQQALILVNHGKATGKEVQQLARDIKASVKEAFDIDLEYEVNIL